VIGRLDGLLLVDKPAGPTSHDVVARLRWATGLRRVGHTGTLDPPATGLLVLVLGRATRLARYLPDSPKRYVGTIRIGVATSTDDLTGEVVRRHEAPPPGAADVVAAAAVFIGAIRQRPPRVSARKVAGARLYRLARRGIEVEAPPSDVVVRRFEITPTEDPHVYAFEADVSSGTYIRSLARDLGDRLGCGGALATLRRVAIGPLSVGDAVPLDAALASQAGLAERVIPIDAMPLAIPSLSLSDDDGPARFRSGLPARCAPVAHPDGTVVAVREGTGAVLGIGAVRDGCVHPRLVLARDVGLPQPDPL
jgi:tRNA pseudouridine55 synthase